MQNITITPNRNPNEKIIKNNKSKGDRICMWFSKDQKKNILYCTELKECRGGERRSKHWVYRMNA